MILTDNPLAALLTLQNDRLHMDFQEDQATTLSSDAYWFHPVAAIYLPFLRTSVPFGYPQSPC